MKTSELIHLALDWAVAKCEGVAVELYAGNFWADPHNIGRKWQWKPHADWAQGGPIIEREEISLCREFSSGKVEWSAWTPAPIRDDAEAFGYGPTPLIAAMRCFVASKLGDDIDIPNELT